MACKSKAALRDLLIQSTNDFFKFVQYSSNLDILTVWIDAYLGTVSDMVKNY